MTKPLYHTDRQYYDYNAQYKVHDKLFTPLHGVSLSDGLFRDCFDANKRYNQNQMDMDRVRYWFDRKEGKETQAIPYIGHFEWNLKGQSASQMLMGIGNSLRWEEDPDLRNLLEEILDFISDAQETDGFLPPVDPKDFAYKEYPNYVRIWLNYGLIAAANSGSKRAFRILRLWQDWFNRCKDLNVIKYLELAFQGVVASAIVYNSEIGTEEDMEVTRKYYEESWRLAQFLGHEKDAVYTRRQHGHEPHPHGTELEAFEGYLDLYRYTGAPYFLNAVLAAAEEYKKEWQHPGGGIIMNEHLKGNAIRKYALYYDLSHTYNELCSTASWIGIHQRLHRLDPLNEEYVFQIEQSLYNIVLAAQNADVDVNSFMFLDGRKRPPIRPNHCCVGAGTRIIASLPEYLYSMTPYTLSCDIYSSSVLHWQTAHQTVNVLQESSFPESGHVRIKLEMTLEEGLDLNLRIPHYAADTVGIYVNGERIASGEPGSYVSLYRIWKDQDQITFDIPFRWSIHRYPGEDRIPDYSRYAFLYGPVLMAFDAGEDSRNLILPMNPDELTGKLIDGKALHFQIEGVDHCQVKPYYEIKEERFTCFPHFANQDHALS